MRLITFERAGEERVGALLGDAQALDLRAAARRLGLAEQAFGSLQTLIEHGEPGLDLARSLLEQVPQEAVLAMGDLRVLAPLPRPVRIRDTTMFTEHMEALLEKMARDEAATAEDPDAAYAELKPKYSPHPLTFERVLYYLVDPASISGPDDDIVWPAYSSWADFELELGMVVGTTARDVTPEAARSCIFGFTMFNDWSARDELYKLLPTNIGPGGGKEFDGSLGLGPCVATLDEFPDLAAIGMTVRVNGETQAVGSTKTMRWTFEEAIVQLSGSRSLHAGEIMGTGTVLDGCWMEHGRSLEDGDVVELEADVIGTLRNTVRIPHVPKGSGPS